MLLLSFFVGECNGQIKQNEKTTKVIASIDTTAKPKLNVRVNKKYDKKGNLVQYDSTYSYFYNSPEFNNSISNDSVYSNFKSPLQNN